MEGAGHGSEAGEVLVTDDDKECWCADVDVWIVFVFVVNCESVAFDGVSDGVVLATRGVMDLVHSDTAPLTSIPTTHEYQPLTVWHCFPLT